MRIYFDSSALVKRYIKESGTGAVVKLCSRASTVLLSCLSLLEFISALSRRKAEGKISVLQFQLLKKEFAADIEEAELLDVSPEVIRTAVNCLEKIQIKTLDAVHVASAMVANCDLFVSADRTQCHAAKAVNLKIEFIAS